MPILGANKLNDQDKTPTQNKSQKNYGAIKKSSSNSQNKARWYKGKRYTQKVNKLYILQKACNFCGDFKGRQKNK